jgi:hypothetical protein
MHDDLPDSDKVQLPAPGEFLQNDLELNGSTYLKQAFAR